VKEKRKYNKKSQYWDRFKQQDQPIENILQSTANLDTIPETAGESFYVQSTQASSVN